MVLAGFLVLGDVGEMREVIGVLAGPVDVTYLVLADGLLRSGKETHTESNQRNGPARESNGASIARSSGDACSASWENDHRPLTIDVNSYLIDRIEKLDATQRDGQNDVGRPIARLFRFPLLQLLDGAFRRFRTADVPHQRRAQVLQVSIDFILKID